MKGNSPETSKINETKPTTKTMLLGVGKKLNDKPALRKSIDLSLRTPPRSKSGSSTPTGQFYPDRRNVRTSYEDLQNARDRRLHLALLYTERMPHVRSQNQARMVPWSDVKEILLPSCSDPDCDIVLNALKVVCCYPWSSESMHPCSPKEQMDFLRSFRLVPSGTLLVDVQEVQEKLETIWEIVRQKHTTSLDENSLRCHYTKAQGSTQEHLAKKEKNDDATCFHVKFGKGCNQSANETNEECDGNDVKCNESLFRLQHKATVPEIGTMKIEFRSKPIVTKDQKKESKNSTTKNEENELSIECRSAQLLTHKEEGVNKSTYILDKEMVVPILRPDKEQKSSVKECFMAMSLVSKFFPKLRYYLLEKCRELVVGHSSSPRVRVRCCTTTEARTFTSWILRHHGWDKPWQHITSRDVLIDCDSVIEQLKESPQSSTTTDLDTDVLVEIQTPQLSDIPNLDLILGNCSNSCDQLIDNDNFECESVYSDQTDESPSAENSESTSQSDGNPCSESHDPQMMPAQPENYFVDMTGKASNVHTVHDRDSQETSEQHGKGFNKKERNSEEETVSVDSKQEEQGVAVNVYPTSSSNSVAEDKTFGIICRGKNFNTLKQEKAENSNKQNNICTCKNNSQATISHCNPAQNEDYCQLNANNSEACSPPSLSDLILQESTRRDSDIVAEADGHVDDTTNSSKNYALSSELCHVLGCCGNTSIVTYNTNRKEFEYRLISEDEVRSFYTGKTNDIEGSRIEDTSSMGVSPTSYIRRPKKKFRIKSPQYAWDNCRDRNQNATWTSTERKTTTDINVDGQSAETVDKADTNKGPDKTSETDTREKLRSLEQKLLTTIRDCKNRRSRETSLEPFKFKRVFTSKYQRNQQSTAPTWNMNKLLAHETTCCKKTPATSETPTTFVKPSRSQDTYLDGKSGKTKEVRSGSFSELHVVFGSDAVKSITPTITRKKVLNVLSDNSRPQVFENGRNNIEWWNRRRSLPSRHDKKSMTSYAETYNLMSMASASPFSQTVESLKLLKDYHNQVSDYFTKKADTIKVTDGKPKLLLDPRLSRQKHERVRRTQNVLPKLDPNAYQKRSTPEIGHTEQKVPFYKNYGSSSNTPKTSKKIVVKIPSVTTDKTGIKEIHILGEKDKESVVTETSDKMQSPKPSGRVKDEDLTENNKQDGLALPIISQSEDVLRANRGKTRHIRKSFSSPVLKGSSYKVKVNDLKLTFYRLEETSRDESSKTAADIVENVNIKQKKKQKTQKHKQDKSDKKKKRLAKPRGNKSHKVDIVDEADDSIQVVMAALQRTPNKSAAVRLPEVLQSSGKEKKKNTDKKTAETVDNNELMGDSIPELEGNDNHPIFIEDESDDDVVVIESCDDSENDDVEEYSVTNENESTNNNRFAQRQMPGINLPPLSTEQNRKGTDSLKQFPIQDTSNKIEKPQGKNMHHKKRWLKKYLLSHETLNESDTETTDCEHLEITDAQVVADPNTEVLFDTVAIFNAGTDVVDDTDEDLHANTDADYDTDEDLHANTDAVFDTDEDLHANTDAVDDTDEDLHANTDAVDATDDDVHVYIDAVDDTHEDVIANTDEGTDVDSDTGTEANMDAIKVSTTDEIDNLRFIALQPNLYVSETNYDDLEETFVQFCDYKSNTGIKVVGETIEHEADSLVSSQTEAAVNNVVAADVMIDGDFTFDLVEEVVVADDMMLPRALVSNEQCNTEEPGEQTEFDGNVEKIDSDMTIIFEDETSEDARQSKDSESLDSDNSVNMLSPEYTSEHCHIDTEGSRRVSSPENNSISFQLGANNSNADKNSKCKSLEMVGSVYIISPEKRPSSKGGNNIIRRSLRHSECPGKSYVDTIDLVDDQSDDGQVCVEKSKTKTRKKKMRKKKVSKKTAKHQEQFKYDSNDCHKGTTPKNPRNVKGFVQEQRRILDIISKTNGKSSSQSSVRADATDKKDVTSPAKPALMHHASSESHELTERCVPIYDKDGMSHGGLVELDGVTCPYVVMNGFKFIALVDAVKIFRLCTKKCAIPKLVLNKHKGLYKTFCTWEQVYTMDLLFRQKGRYLTTGDVLLRLDRIKTHLTDIRSTIEQLHRNTKLKNSQACKYNTD